MLPPRDDLHFWLYDWLQADTLAAMPAFAHVDRETGVAMIDAALDLAASHFLPHAAASDQNPPKLVDGRVELMTAIAEALAAYREAGFFGMEAPAEEGGLGLPYTFVAALGGLFSCANVATNGYAFLTQAAANLIREVGSDEQKRRFLPAMNEGRWFGTMCLSEPQAGSSLADLRCVAEPLPDGRYAIRGNKMWISSGDHEIAENIVHLVLAKIPGGPAGTKGISLFIVPRRHVDAEGKAGARNGVRLIGLNHKLGTHGQVNCLLGFGEEEPAIGELVGAPHDGLRGMFVMMNEARIGVGIGAAMTGYGGYRAALTYAKERRQGRRPGERDATTPMVPIIEHADVRRMLLKAKSFAEGGLALCLYAGRLVDEAKHGGDAEAQALVDLLTPIVKAWPSDYGQEANSLAIQVHGGAGYTRDFPVERLWRENRINAIHEGTNGIQAMDLLGRKLLGDGGKAFGLLSKRVEATLAAARADAALAPLAEALAARWVALGPAVLKAGKVAASDLELALANAYLLLDAMGHAVVAWLWLDQALAANRALAAGDVRRAMLEGKVAAARYFIDWELPTKDAVLARFASIDPLCRDLDPAVL
ncbi:acyl-CoA dehydrogenase [Silanimonas sp.]|jgi:butyryl-CoA dehydrogenase|uniref:acyl-CoA dehydrogenase n=1 Tax=Silanimonas sp. TaxID=1929290 RepID=UPI0022C5F637|nr:acyl-CoA dehydrogenase [Silanimonas sp.]MCZ8061946.1 acyl-CoA dehydrogenase [Silanimonas sp.]